MIFRSQMAEVLKLTGFCTLVLIMLVLLTRYSIYLRSAVDGDIAVHIIMPIILWRLPDFMAQSLPMGFLAAVLIVLTRKHNDGEQAILVSCGIGFVRQMWQLVVISLPIMLLVALLTLVIAPYGIGKVDQLRNQSRSIEWVEDHRNGHFFTGDSGELVYVDNLLTQPDSIIVEGLFIAERSGETENDLNVMITPRADMYLAEDGRIRLNMQTGEVYNRIGKREVINTTSFGMMQYTLNDSLFRKRVRISRRGKTSAELLSSGNPAELAEFFWRLSLPLMLPVLAILAFALSPTPGSRQQRLFYVLEAFIIFFIYLSLAGYFESAMGKDEIPLWFAFWPLHLSILGISIWIYFLRFSARRLLKRIHFQSRPA